jgi:hypothetical protein
MRPKPSAGGNPKSVSLGLTPDTQGYRRAIFWKDLGQIRSVNFIVKIGARVLYRGLVIFRLKRVASLPLVIARRWPVNLKFVIFHYLEDSVSPPLARGASIRSNFKLRHYLLGTGLR